MIIYWISVGLCALYSIYLQIKVHYLQASFDAYIEIVEERFEEIKDIHLQMIDNNKDLIMSFQNHLMDYDEFIHFINDELIGGKPIGAKPTAKPPQQNFEVKKSNKKLN